MRATAGVASGQTQATEGAGAGVRSSRRNRSTPARRRRRGEKKDAHSPIIYERGQDDGGKTAAMLSEAHARPQARPSTRAYSAAVFSSAVDAEYAFSKISPPEPPAPLTLPDEGSYSPTCCALPFHDQ